MAVFKDFKSFTDKLKSKVKKYTIGVNEGLIDGYSDPRLTGFQTGYLRSAFRVSDKPGAASQVRTVEERFAAANGTTEVDSTRLKAELKSSVSSFGIIYHYNEAFYSGKQELDKFTYRVPLNNLNIISSEVASRLVRE